MEDLPELYSKYRDPVIVVDIPKEWIVDDDKIMDSFWKESLRTGRSYVKRVPGNVIEVMQFVSQE